MTEVEPKNVKKRKLNDDNDDDNDDNQTIGSEINDYFSFFDRDCLKVCFDLIGKILYNKNNETRCRIIEAEAYYRGEKGSHASLGKTKSRISLFKKSGTIYMYYSRGGASLNFSTKGGGNAVLIKSAIVEPSLVGSNSKLYSEMVKVFRFIYKFFRKKKVIFIVNCQKIQNNNPIGVGKKIRPVEKLCSGQTILCKGMNITVKEFDGLFLGKESNIFILDDGYKPRKTYLTERLGIPKGRDDNLKLRIVDYDFAKQSTKPPAPDMKSNKTLSYDEASKIEGNIDLGEENDE